LKFHGKDGKSLQRLLFYNTCYSHQLCFFSIAQEFMCQFRRTKGIILKQTEIRLKSHRGFTGGGQGRERKRTGQTNGLIVLSKFVPRRSVLG